MKKIYVLAVLFLGLSCDSASENIFEKDFERGGFIEFLETPESTFGFANLEEAIISGTLIDNNNNATSYSLTVQLDDLEAKDFKVVTTFPSDISITLDEALGALGITRSDITPDSIFKFIGVVTTPNGTFSGDSVSFNSATNQQEGGDTASQIIAGTAANAMLFTMTFLPPNAIVIAIDSSSDDVEESEEDGRMVLDSSDLELGEFDTSGTPDLGVQNIGLRFNGVAIPEGATLFSAAIQFTVDNTGSDPVQLTIYGEAVGNAAPYVDELNNLSNRTLTSANAVWDIPEWENRGDKGLVQKTVDLTAIVNEILNRPDWAAGNSLNIIMKHTGPSVGVTSSSGGREAETFDGTAAPELILSYLD